MKVSSGVSLDEETAKMIEFQKLTCLCTLEFRTTDEMMDAVLKFEEVQ
ncbi:MAG: hypothetical protein H6625_01470 [Bdellovibrionaceae bacterium]|nr:hypothetical protein [Pseudobdellovibrionaceae bacterium]